MVLFVGSKSFKSELQQTLNSLVTDPESAVRRSIGMGFHEVRRQRIKSHFSFNTMSVSTNCHCFRSSNFWGAAVFSFSTTGCYCFATANSRLCARVLALSLSAQGRLMLFPVNFAGRSFKVLSLTFRKRSIST